MMLNCAVFTVSFIYCVIKGSGQIIETLSIKPHNYLITCRNDHVEPTPVKQFKLNMITCFMEVCPLQQL